MEAEIILEFDKANIAEAIARAVSPDNYKTPEGLSVRTTSKDKKVTTLIKCKGKLSTFIATVDDLLFCTATAEKTLQKAQKLK